MMKRLRALPLSYSGVWSRRRDSNPRPRALQACSSIGIRHKGAGSDKGWETRPMLYPIELRHRLRDRGRIRTGNRRLHVVPQAFVAQSDWLTTRVVRTLPVLLSECDQPGLEPEPFGLPCIPTGIRQPKCLRSSATIGAGRIFLSYRTCARPGIEPGPPGDTGRSTCSPAGIRAAQNCFKDQIGADELLSRRTGLNVVPTAFDPESFPECRALPGPSSILTEPCSALPPREGGPRHKTAPTLPPPWRQTASDSITPTQWSPLSSPFAKVARISNTASEKPPTFRMSARSCACVEP